MKGRHARLLPFLSRDVQTRSSIASSRGNRRPTDITLPHMNLNGPTSRHLTAAAAAAAGLIAPSGGSPLLIAPSGGSLPLH